MSKAWPFGTMSKKHPCRKIILNQIDRLILAELEKREGLDFDDALELTGLQKTQLIKRLNSLHREGYLRFFSNGRILASSS